MDTPDWSWVSSPSSKKAKWKRMSRKNSNTLVQWTLWIDPECPTLLVDDKIYGKVIWQCPFSKGFSPSWMDTLDQSRVSNPSSEITAEWKALWIFRGFLVRSDLRTRAGHSGLIQSVHSTSGIPIAEWTLIFGFWNKLTLNLRVGCKYEIIKFSNRTWLSY